MSDLTQIILMLIKLAFYLVNIFLGTYLTRYHDEEEPEASSLTRFIGGFMAFAGLLCLIELIMK